jgi:hypothetical protein
VVTRIITEGLFTIPPHDDSIQKMRVQLESRGTGTLIKMEPVVFRFALFGLNRAVTSKAHEKDLDTFCITRVWLIGDYFFLLLRIC